MPTLMELSKGVFIDLDRIVLIEEVDEGKSGKMLRDSNYMKVSENSVLIKFDMHYGGVHSHHGFTGEDNKILRAWLDDFRSK